MKYEYQGYPKVVYGPEANDDGSYPWLTVASPDEVPDGWCEEPGGEPLVVDDAEREAAEAAKAKAKEAQDAEKKAIQEYLDEHDVDYDKRLGLKSLQELKVKLDQHLAQPKITTPGD